METPRTEDTFNHHVPSVTRKTLLLTVCTLLAGWFLLVPGPANAQRIDMRNTKHNLARTEGGDNTDPRQICVFCHTPMDNSGEAAQPKWQSTTPPNGTFLMFDDIGRMGNEGNQAVGSQSIACLSCHDSSQAFGIAGGSQDHPFAIPYRGALSAEQRKQIRETLKRAGKLINPGQFVKFDDGFRKASRGVVDNRPVWWVSKSMPSAQRGRLDIPLFVRVDEEDQTEIPFVECASCHDPHTVRPLFLRTEANASELCLTCHIK
ncbi:cytochrome c3 family protein [Aromatoleum sp.]|uniref:cytochrome c3 family protein n=1 Tax=Aromatoleum sp. TaxID=2307007 RepID=UPI002B464F36|nr:cytochrome c3 family protein [Aromatoleum sp.]